MSSGRIPRLSIAAMRMTRAGRHAIGAAMLGMLLTAAGTAHAKIVLDIPDTTSEIESNVRAFLSLTRYADRTDVTPEVMSRLQRRIVTETRRALEPLGYYQPEITHEVVRDGGAPVHFERDETAPVREFEVVGLLDRWAGADLGRHLGDREADHARRPQLGCVRSAAVVGSAREVVVDDRAQCECLLVVVLDRDGCADDDDRPVVHRVVERGSGEHERVEQSVP